jgi:hypothetical protein
MSAEPRDIHPLVEPCPYRGCGAPVTPDAFELHRRRFHDGSVGFEPGEERALGAKAEAFREALVVLGAIYRSVEEGDR